MAAFAVVGFVFFFLLSSSSACDRCVHISKATFTSQITSGACGYGSMASEYFKGRLLVGGAPSLFNQGAGCGACFKVRCKNSTVCKSEGTLVTLTDSHGDNNNAFVMSKEAFAAMANKGRSQDLIKFGVVNIEYKRVPCVYYRNLALRVEDSSNKPYYLAVKVLYQGGQTDILGVDVAQIGSRQWTSMRRSYGAVWDTNAVLTGALKFRFLVNSGYNRKYILAEKVLPADWEKGLVYDTGVMITDIAQETCDHWPYACDINTW